MYLNRPMTRRESAFTSALFIYMTAVVVLITLLPLNFRIPAKYQITWSFDASDMITNVILFLPVGFLFRLSRGRKNDPFCIKTLGFGIMLSSCIEFTQFFVPGRFTQISDVLTNSLGALLGAIVFVLLKGRSKENEAIRILTLELPLMNLAYLLIPLMWLNGLANGGEEARLWLLLSLGLFGGGVLASIYVHRLKQAGSLTPNKLSLITASWFIVASLPTLANFPLEVTGFTIIVAAFVQIFARIPNRKKKEDRRFELPTLKMLLPLYVLYLILLALWPTTLPLQDWQSKAHFGELTLNERIVFIFRFVEILGAFTLFGYQIAEMRGRKKESLKRALVWIFFITLAFSVTLVMVKAYPLPLGSDILETLLMTCAGIYGGLIYRLQLAAIGQ
jgi:glycopeptide antibiotics resistance protein